MYGYGMWMGSHVAFCVWPLSLTVFSRLSIIVVHTKMSLLAERQWLTPIILTTQEADHQED
jgi:hypothetical protein